MARVLRREPRRRIILSQGQQPGQILGTISGSALTVLDLEPRADRVNSRLTAYVRIDNRFAAALTRMLVASFGFLADRKLGDELLRHDGGRRVGGRPVRRLLRVARTRRSRPRQ